MKSIRKKLAVLLAVLLMIPALPAAAEEPADAANSIVTENLGEVSVSGNVVSPVSGKEMLALKLGASEKVTFNTGNYEWNIVDASVSANVVGHACFEEDGSYTINIPESNPFFPYEVQFTCDGKATNQWFMTPDDSVEVGGHTFYVSAYFDNTVVTQMSLNVSGKTMVAYPEKKEFTKGDRKETKSLLPLTERRLSVDLSAFTPVELTMVSIASIFTGTNQLQNTDKVVWTYSYEDNYKINQSGDRIDLSYGTCNGTSDYWQMIAGDDNQLASNNIRYIVEVKNTESKNWLTSAIYTQNSDGSRTKISATNSSYNDYYYNTDRNRQLDIYAPFDEWKGEKAFLSLKINPSVFSGTVYDHVKVFEGQFTKAEEAISGTDITAQIFNTDMTQNDAGYALDSYTGQGITLVTFDAGNNITGYLPLELDCNFISNYMSASMFKRTENNRENVVDSSRHSSEGGYQNRIMTLYEGYAANNTYYLTMDYYKLSVESSTEVTAAYAGKYSSIAEAVSSGATDIKDDLYSDNYNTAGYAADYSQGIYFTIFVGADNTAAQEIHRYYIKTEEGTTPKNTSGSGTDVWFTGLKDSNGAYISSYEADSGEDSYGEYNYITILVDANTDLHNIAPVFNTSNGVKLYSAGSSTPEVSGASYHNFSNGPVHYTSSAENGINSKNYWLHVVKAVSDAGRLYINSLDDEESNTREENGIIYSTREVMLDGYHEYVHDIWLANIGTQSIPSLSAELQSDVVELDDYWTLKGDYELAGFGTTNTSTSYGELPNLAKIRLRAKKSAVKGTDVSGTLTIKSGTTTLMVLSLTGIIGDPTITTKEIPQAVKYVPYGTMIQNNNKYSWNNVRYWFVEGALPAGMEVKQNGEIYGVPGETGEFTFTVIMQNSHNSFADSTMTYTLVVNENTNANVDAAVDSGYELTQRVTGLNITNSMDPELYGSQTLVSEGTYAEFVDIYLDGVKLAKDVDYTSEAGSTRITIRNQTLALTAKGTHTLGIEFRTQDTNTLKRAAQNYDNEKGSGSGGNNSGSGSNSGGGNGSGSNNSGMINTKLGNIANRTAISSAAGNYETISYTVKSGDTLWKIAEKYYGSGKYWKKIFEDNKETIGNPDKIYAGQVIIINLDEENAAASKAEGTPYTVKSGDTLYKIAEKQYGKGWKWRKIYQANKEVITSPENIYAGQVIIIPED